MVVPRQLDSSDSQARLGSLLLTVVSESAMYLTFISLVCISAGMDFCEGVGEVPRLSH